MSYVLIELENISSGAKYNSIFCLFRKGEEVTPEVFSHFKVDFLGDKSSPGESSSP